MAKTYNLPSNLSVPALLELLIETRKELKYYYLGSSMAEKRRNSYTENMDNKLASMGIDLSLVDPLAKYEHE